MFTGIIEEIGTVSGVRRGMHSAVLAIKASAVLEGTKIGDSIAVSGVCLTVTGFGAGLFTADAMHETLNRSSLAAARIGTPVNLERAMASDGRFGGHIVSGHVDATGRILSIVNDDNAIWYRISADSSLLRYIAEKGSVAIDGISLTVAAVDKNSFSVSVIPHTARNTTLSLRHEGDEVNIETDIIAKYVESLLSGKKSEGLTLDKLAAYGFMEA